MDITALSNSIEDVYNDPLFYITLESHLTKIKQDKNNKVVNVTEHQNYKFEGDFYGLLNEFHIPPQYHYICMRINGIENSSDYLGNLYAIAIPNLGEIDLLKNIFLTSNL